MYIVFFCILHNSVSYDAVKINVVKNASPVTGLGLCSFLVAMATIPHFGSEYHWEAAVTLIIAIFSILMVGQLLFKYQRNSDFPESAFNILITLFVLWLFEAGLTTTHGPFLVTGNGKLPTTCS